MTHVTILSTVYNIRDTVERWLNGLLNQDYDDYDIVIIDNCSEDGTLSVIKDYCKKNPIIKLYVKKTKQPEALNYAIESSLVQGELVALIDGDCEAPSNWLSTLVSSLNKHHADVVGGPGLTPLDATFLQRIIGMDLDFRFISTKEGPVCRHPNMNMLIRRNILEENRFNENLNVAYDTDYGYQISKNGYTIWYDPNAFVYHYHRSTYKGYLRQQVTTAKYAFSLYANRPYALAGDNINPIFMIAQPIFLFFLMASLVSLLVIPSLILVIASLVGLLISILAETFAGIIALRKPYAILLFPLIIVRLVAWTLGGIEGMYLYFGSIVRNSVS